MERFNGLSGITVRHNGGWVPVGHVIPGHLHNFDHVWDVEAGLWRAECDLPNGQHVTDYVIAPGLLEMVRAGFVELPPELDGVWTSDEPDRLIMAHVQHRLELVYAPSPMGGRSRCIFADRRVTADRKIIIDGLWTGWPPGCGYDKEWVSKYGFNAAEV